MMKKYSPAIARLQSVLLQHYCIYFFMVIHTQFRISPVFIGLNTIIMSERFWSVHLLLHADDTWMHTYFRASRSFCRTLSVIVVVSCVVDFMVLIYHRRPYHFSVQGVRW